MFHKAVIKSERKHQTDLKTRHKSGRQISSSVVIIKISSSWILLSLLRPLLCGLNGPKIFNKNISIQSIINLCRQPRSCNCVICKYKRDVDIRTLSYLIIFKYLALCVPIHDNLPFILNCLTFGNCPPPFWSFFK